MFLGGGLEQTRVCTDGLTESAELEGRVVLALVITGVGGLNEGTKVFFREETAMGAVVEGTVVTSEAVRSESLWVGKISLAVEAVGLTGGTTAAVSVPVGGGEPTESTGVVTSLAKVEG